MRAKRPVALCVVEALPAGATGKVKRRMLDTPEVPVLYTFDLVGDHGRVAALAPAQPVRGTRKRLDHIDAMRPVKQAGVVSTHTLLFFAPVAAGLAVGASLQLLHVTREAFLFVSACMLAYSVRDLPGIDHRTFWRRRFALVAVPYLCWTVIYFLVGLPSEHGTPRADTIHLLYLFGTGYYQLYYLLVLLEFYALFPLLLVLLRRTGRAPRPRAPGERAGADRAGVHHALGPGAGLDAGLLGHPRGDLVPVLSGGRHGGRHASRRVPRLALLARAASSWPARWPRPSAAEVWYYLAADRVASWLGSSSDPFQPIVIPFNIGAIACIYLIGVALVHRRRSKRTRADGAVGVGQLLRDLSGPGALHHGHELARLAASQRVPALAAGRP